jgi:regulatory protein YycI of two-component signal transduction system YycFG
MEGFIYGYYSGVVESNSTVLDPMWFANDLQMRDDTIT